MNEECDAQIFPPAERRGCAIGGAAGADAAAGHRHCADAPQGKRAEQRGRVRRIIGRIVEGSDRFIVRRWRRRRRVGSARQPRRRQRGRPSRASRCRFALCVAFSPQNPPKNQPNPPPLPREKPSQNPRLLPSQTPNPNQRCCRALRVAWTAKRCSISTT